MLPVSPPGSEGPTTLLRRSDAMYMHKHLTAIETTMSMRTHLPSRKSKMPVIMLDLFERGMV